MSDSVTIECPKCRAEQEDFDGFGVPYCHACGYCAHFSRTGDANGNLRCDICNDVLSSGGSDA